MLFRISIFLLIFFQNTLVFSKCNFNTSEYLNALANPNNIKIIEIETPKSQRYVRNFLQTYSSVIENGFISSKHKRRFFANIKVVYDFGVCNFEGRIRQSGDWPDHIKLQEGKPLRSLDVRLVDGNIVNSVRFKLLIPETRYNYNEILGTLFLKKLGFIAPETFQVITKVNGNTSLMLFQEKAVKELLEKNYKREGPIFEGDETLLWGYKDHGLFELVNVSLSKLINENWFLKGRNHQHITLQASQKLQEAYIDHTKNFLKTKTVLYPNDRKNEVFTNYHLLIESMNGQHALAPHNRKFYYNVYSNNFEPIYYDGMLELTKPIENFNENIYSKKQIEKINTYLNILSNEKIQSELKFEFFSRIKQNDNIFFTKSLNQLSNNLNKIMDFIDKSQLKKIKNDKMNNKEFYFQNHKKHNLNQYLIEKIKFQEDGYEVQLKETLNQKILNRKISALKLAEILSNNELEKKRIVFLPENMVSKSLAQDSYNLKKTKFNDGDIHYSKNLNFEILNKKKLIKIYQNSLNDWILFSNMNLKDWKIEFIGKKYNKKDYAFQRMNIWGMTGCINFFNVKLQNIYLNISDGYCEDSVNVVNSLGNIKSLDVQSSYADAIDLDFSKIDIDKINVNNAGNDCIDLSGGNYKIFIATLNNCSDKAISVGEKSKLDIETIRVNNAKTGLATKDSSISEVNEAIIENIEICLSAYNKKQEFFGGQIKTKNIKCRNFTKKTNIDDVSKIIMNN